MIIIIIFFIPQQKMTIFIFIFVDAREIIMWVYVMTSIVNLFCRSAVQA